MNVTQGQDRILFINIVLGFIFFLEKKEELTMNVGGCLLKEII